MLPKLARRTKQPEIPIGNPEAGAVIFGQSEKFRLWFPRDARRAPEMDADGSKSAREAQRDDERIVANNHLSPPVAETSSSASRSNDATSDLRSSAANEDSDSLTPATSVESPENSYPQISDRTNNAVGANRSGDSRGGVGIASGAPGSRSIPNTLDRLKTRFSRKNRSK